MKSKISAVFFTFFIAISLKIQAMEDINKIPRLSEGKPDFSYFVLSFSYLQKDHLSGQELNLIYTTILDCLANIFVLDDIYNLEIKEMAKLSINIRDLDDIKAIENDKYTAKVFEFNCEYFIGELEKVKNSIDKYKIPLYILPTNTLARRYLPEFSLKFRTISKEDFDINAFFDFVIKNPKILENEDYIHSNEVQKKLGEYFIQITTIFNHLDKAYFAAYEHVNSLYTFCHKALERNNNINDLITSKKSRKNKKHKKSITTSNPLDKTISDLTIKINKLQNEVKSLINDNSKKDNIVITLKNQTEKQSDKIQTLKYQLIMKDKKISELKNKLLEKPQPSAIPEESAEILQKQRSDFHDYIQVVNKQIIELLNYTKNLEQKVVDLQEQNKFINHQNFNLQKSMNHQAQQFMNGYELSYKKILEHLEMQNSFFVQDENDFGSSYLDPEHMQFYNDQENNNNNEN